MRTEKIGEWMTYRQAEEFSGLSRTTLWRLVSEGEVEAAKVGRAVRINRESLDAYMRGDSENGASVASARME